MKEKEEWLIVGIITSTYGIKGQLKIKSLSDFEERFTVEGQRWLQKENENPISCELISGFQKPGKDIFIVSLRGIHDRNEAEKLIRCKLLVKKENLPLLDEDEFHFLELLDLEVKINKNNILSVIGNVTDLISEYNDLLEIKLHSNNKKVLIPFVKDIVPVINKKEGFIIIDPPKGLLEL